MTARRQRAFAAGIVGLAVLVRVLHLWFISDDVFFDAPVIDARLNVDDAHYLADRSWAGPPRPYWKPPLYAYTLATQLAVFGDTTTAPRVLQVLLDAGSCLLVLAIGSALFSRKIGLAAAAITALSGPMIYFSGELVSASLAVFLDLAALYLLIRARSLDEPSPGRWLAAGAALGLAALVRPEVLLFAAVVAASIAFRRKAWSRRQRAGAIAALAGGVLLLVAPVAVRNAVRGGDAVLISANGGINFYIGTDRRYQGMVGLRPGTEWERLIREPERVGIVGVGSSHSSYFTRKALRLIADDPVGYAGHALAKAGIFWHGYEVMSNLDVYDTRDQSPVLAILLWDVPGLYFPFGLLGPLALLGLALAVRERHPARLLIGFVAVLVGVAMLFFVTARFRLPLVPIAALFAAYAVAWCVAAARAHRRRALAIAVACAVAAAAFANSSAFSGRRAAYRRQVAAEKHHYRGTALFFVHGRYDEAVRELRAAIAIDPTRASTHFNLGQTYERMGRAADTVAAMRAAVRVAGDARGEGYLIGPAIGAISRAVSADDALRATGFGRGISCMNEASWDCAVAAFAGERDDAFLALALLSRGEAHLRAGRDQSAAVDLRDAALLRPSVAETRLLLGLADHRLGVAEEARAAFAAFRALEWPRGAYFRAVIEQTRPTGELDVELLRALLSYMPDDRHAAEALRSLESR